MCIHSKKSWAELRHNIIGTAECPMKLTILSLRRDMEYKTKYCQRQYADDLHDLLYILFLSVSLLRDSYYTKANLLSFFFCFKKQSSLHDSIDFIVN